MKEAVGVINPLSSPEDGMQATDEFQNMRDLGGVIHPLSSRVEGMRAAFLNYEGGGRSY